MSAEHEIIFRDDVTVELVKASASDADVIWAARVSTAGDKSLESVGNASERDAGLIIEGVTFDVSHGGTYKTTVNIQSFFNSTGSGYVTGVSSSTDPVSATAVNMKNKKKPIVFSMMRRKKPQ